MPEEIPDGMDETPVHPRTVEGKIMEMRDVGVALFESTDELGELMKNLQDYVRARSPEGLVTISGTERWFDALTRHILKLSTLTQLQTDAITQLYGELSGPGGPSW